MSELLQAALRYRPRTVPLIPGTKRPAVERWPDWPATAESVRVWWREHPDSNVGIRTGNGLAVIDVDPRHGGDVHLADLEREHGPLPPTPEVITGGDGRHLYFRAPRALRSVQVTPGLEIKADGRQVVAPPSIHPSGHVYAWARPLVEAEIAQLPAWFVQLAGCRYQCASNGNLDADDPLRRIPATTYVPALLGVELGHNGKIVCPFHPDTDPSLQAYADDRGWFCFGCRRGGSIVDFGAALYGMTPRGQGFHLLRRRLASELLSLAGVPQ